MKKFNFLFLVLVLAVGACSPKAKEKEEADAVAGAGNDKCKATFAAKDAPEGFKAVELADLKGKDGYAFVINQMTIFDRVVSKEKKVSTIEHTINFASTFFDDFDQDPKTVGVESKITCNGIEDEALKKEGLGYTLPPVLSNEALTSDWIAALKLTEIDVAKGLIGFSKSKLPKAIPLADLVKAYDAEIKKGGSKISRFYYIKNDSDIIFRFQNIDSKTGQLQIASMHYVSKELPAKENAETDKTPEETKKADPAADLCLNLIEKEDRTKWVAVPDAAKFLKEKAGTVFQIDNLLLHNVFKDSKKTSSYEYRASFTGSGLDIKVAGKFNCRNIQSELPVTLGFGAPIGFTSMESPVTGILQFENEDVKKNADTKVEASQVPADTTLQALLELDKAQTVETLKGKYKAEIFTDENGSLIFLTTHEDETLPDGVRTVNRLLVYKPVK